MGWNGSIKSTSGNACTCQNQKLQCAVLEHQDRLNLPFPAVQGNAHNMGEVYL